MIQLPYDSSPGTNRLVRMVLGGGATVLAIIALAQVIFNVSPLLAGAYLLTAIGALALIAGTARWSRRLIRTDRSDNHSN